MSTCIDCLDNCSEPVSDGCVKYTGEDIPCLGICKGDALYQFEVAIAEKLCATLDGTGINVTSLVLNCTFLTDLLGTNQGTLAEILQMLADGECSLRALIKGLDDTINTPYSFNTSCLSGLGAIPTRDDILNAALIKLCSVDSRVSAIEADYVKDSELCAKVAACISGSGSIIQEYTKIPKYVALPYHGPLSVFDSAGVGLSAFGYDKVYICNGQVVGSFITPDYRGRSPLGANIGIPGGSLDSSVNPALPANSGYGIAVGVKQGSYTNTLTTDEMPAHNHSVNDPGHKHTLAPYVGDGAQGSSNPSLKGDSSNNEINPINTTEVTTGITVGSAGNSQPHNNLQPSIASCFIMYIP